MSVDGSIALSLVGVCFTMLILLSYSWFASEENKHTPSIVMLSSSDPSGSTKGDARQSGYDTSQKLEFPAKELPFTQPFPHQRGGNIPEGDREKEVTQASTMRDSYLSPEQRDLSKVRRDCLRSAWLND